LAVAAVRFAIQQLQGLKFNLIEAIESFCGLVPATIGTQNIVFDLPATRRFAEMLKPLKLFGKDHIASLMYDFADAQYLLSFGKEKQGTELLEKLQRVFPDPALKKVLGEAHWKAMYGGILFSLGILYPYEFGGRALEIAREMESLDVRVWAMAAEEVRMLHHALRGESEAVQRCRERVELFAVQGSTTWQADIFWPILLMDSEIRAGDTIAVRTIREQLSRRSKDHPSLQAFADVAHCTYLAMRGEHVAAIAAFESFHEKLGALEPALTWPAFRASFAFAGVLNAMGEHERAKRYATESLARAGADVERVVGHYLEPQRQLALAEAGLGHHAQAVSRLDALLSKHGGEDQPLLIGLLHKARAEVAIRMQDKPAFELHFSEMERRFGDARNPSLIAQIEQVAVKAMRAGVRTSLSLAARAVPAIQPLDSVSAVTQRALSDLSGVSERAAFALRLVLKGSQAKGGYLYLLKGERLELAAQSAHNEPGQQLEARLLREIEQARLRALEDESMTDAIDTATVVEEPKSMFIDSAATAVAEPSSASPAEPTHRMLVLSTKRDGELVVVGGLIVELSPEHGFAIDVELLEPIASALHESVASESNAASSV
jgi:hypothetical protein